ncbi:LacI family DNA-binding transcriptional regulator [Streptomyces sp. NPDC005813]|uniref:LacI family DNA-binding transcriptional regulator n=1 Tax=Streptomyces sp. NPDC005813 TaxID=3155592 RepID=UPI0033E5995F
MAVTIADVAQAAGVSKATVTRVLNTRGEVGKAMAARVRQVIDRMGYVPSSGAVGLARGRSRTVGMPVPSPTWPLVLTDPSRFGCGHDRLAGFRDTCAAHGVDLDLVVEVGFPEADGRATVRRLPAEGREFDAVLAHNDLAALGVPGALRDAGRRVPDDIAVIGFDDIPVARHTEPVLGTVRRPMRETGATAARILLAHLERQDRPLAPVVLPTTMITRRSAPAL